MRQGCGVPLPFVADVSGDCALWGMHVNTTACKGFIKEEVVAATEEEVVLTEEMVAATE